MDIPMNVNVNCVEGHCGVSTYIILDPVTEEVTHLVVKGKEFPHTQRLVPLDYIIESTPHLIRLRCSQAELDQMNPFIETEFISVPTPDDTVAGSLMMWPFGTYGMESMPIEHENIPPGELAVHRGAKVEARDGQAGHVDEFLVEPVNGHITHLVLREGHLWGAKEVTIPVSEIDRVEADTVYLNLDKKSIENLPTIPINRKWA